MLKRKLVIGNLIVLLLSYSCADIEIPYDNDSDTCPCTDTIFEPYAFLDEDEDCIIDVIELEEENFIHAFEIGECDRNLSLSLDQPNNGSMIMGMCSPLNGEVFTTCYRCTAGINDEDGFVNYHGGDPFNYDHWSTHDLHRCIIESAFSWLLQSPLLPMKVGDMSLINGGPFYTHGSTTSLDHASHQNGLDVDIRYMRSDLLNDPLNIVNEPFNYDAFLTQQLISTLLSTCNVDKIFVANEDRLGFTNADLGVENILSHDASGVHDDHFHVRLY